MIDDEQTISKIFNFMVLLAKYTLSQHCVPYQLEYMIGGNAKRGAETRLVAHTGAAVGGTLAIFKQNLFEGFFFHGLMELKIVVPLLQFQKILHCQIWRKIGAPYYTESLLSYCGKVLHIRVVRKTSKMICKFANTGKMYQ